jgi:hypothetical protein
MAVMDCVPMLIPLIALTLAVQLFSMIPISIPGGTPVLTLVLMYFVTYLYAKIFKCWKSDKKIWARSIVPNLIFFGWVFLFFFPYTTAIMMAIGNNPFLIAVLSIIYKLAYDRVFNEC